MSSMQAMVHDAYGPPEVLRLATVERPVPDERSVLVRVRAAALNALDWHFLTGTPGLLRVMARSPARPIPGVDLAGTVEAVGRAVTRFQPGDEVFGAGRGTLAEYAVAPEDALAAKPPAVTFEQAAATPIAGLTALQALRDFGKLRAGQRVLINGASGGVGTFAVQVAKALGAAGVTAVCSTAKVDMARSIGADHVVDYTREDFALSGERYDLLLDNVANRSLSDCRRVLCAGGVYVMVVAGPKKGLLLGMAARMLGAMVSFRAAGLRARPMIARRSAPDLATLGGLIAAGRIAPVIDRFPLGDSREAFRQLGSGHARGKIVVTI